MRHTIDRLLHWTCGALAGLALFIIMWLTLIDVSGRKFLSHSVPGGLELTEVLMVAVIFCALPTVSWRGEHVVFNTFDRFLSPRARALQVRLVHMLSAFVFGALGWLMVGRGQRFASYGDTTSYLLLPLHPIAYGMALLLALTAVVHLVLTFSGDNPEREPDPGAVPEAPL